MNHFIKGVIVVFLLTAASCTKEAYEFSANDACNLSSLTYEGGVNQIINNNCAYSGCHAGTIETFDFTTYEGVKTAIGSFKDRINRNIDDPLFMPQNKFELTECDLAKLNAWLNSGSPLK